MNTQLFTPEYLRFAGIVMVLLVVLEVATMIIDIRDTKKRRKK